MRKLIVTVLMLVATTAHAATPNLKACGASLKPYTLGKETCLAPFFDGMKQPISELRPSGDGFDIVVVPVDPQCKFKTTRNTHTVPMDFNFSKTPKNPDGLPIVMFKAFEMVCKGNNTVKFDYAPKS